jgi:hypothetical protein
VQDAVELADTTDFMSSYIDSRLGLTSVLLAVHRPDEAREVSSELADRLEQRGNVTYAATLRKRFEEAAAR